METYYLNISSYLFRDMAKKQLKNIVVNPYIDNIFGKWAKTIATYLLIIFGAIFAVIAAIKGWIDQTFGVELLFFVAGIIIGNAIKNGKK